MPIYIISTPGEQLVCWEGICEINAMLAIPGLELTYHSFRMLLAAVDLGTLTNSAILA